LLINPTQDFRLSDSQQLFGLAPNGTLRRLLDPLSAWIVLVDPVDVPSFVDTHMRPTFLPFVSRALIVPAVYAAV
jgi:hypothetical protein